MAYIKLDNFVQVVINRHITPSANPSRDTAALFYYVDTAPTTTYDERTQVYTSATYSAITDTTAKAYAKAFFDNGGKKLAVTSSHSTKIADDLDAMGTNIIVVGLASGQLNTIAATYNTSHDGIYKKIFVDYTVSAPTSATTKTAYYVTKYVPTSNSAPQNPESCMAIAAYLAKMDLSLANSVQDYCFTQEVVANDVIVADNNIVEACLNYNSNVDIQLANKIVNVGGNDTDGNDLVNEYVMIVMTQTLTDILVQLLMQKIKYDQYSSARVIAMIASELEAYKSAGYIQPGKMWTDADLVVNGRTIISKGTTLVEGYSITMDSYASLTAAQKQQHQMPNIYLLIADQYSIRKIVISGEVF